MKITLHSIHVFVKQSKILFQNKLLGNFLSEL
jgi:hypothetical protein